MDLSVIVVSNRQREKLRECLEALFESRTDHKFEVIVVDSDSGDGTLEMLDEFFPQVEVVTNIYDAGFARSCNQGINMSQGDFVLLLGSDMRVLPDTLKNMLDWMSNCPDVAVASCAIEDEDRRLVKHVRRFPRLFDQFAIALGAARLFPGVLNGYERSDFDYSKASAVDSVSNSFFMVNINNEKKPPFWLDERYFAWFEVMDYCMKARAMGGEVWYTPAARCVRAVGVNPDRIRGIDKQKHYRDSMLKYFRKWHPAWQYRLLRAAWPIGIGIAYVSQSFKIKRGKNIN